MEQYSYDSHGNIIQMPHLPTMEWDFKDQMHVTQRQVVNTGPGERTYYVYDGAGERIRKVTETASGTKERERIYLGNVFELYREFDSTGSITLAHETLHVIDDRRRVTLVETKTVDTSVAPNTLPSGTKRYQFDNHLGSAFLELDKNAAVISYEEYYPYGSTSYQGGRSAAEVSLKRYRYISKERDEENGFYYCGARYYAPWLARWMSCDPAGMVDGINLYRYVRDNPVNMRDPTGNFGIVEKVAGKVAVLSAEWLVNKVDPTGRAGLLSAAAGFYLASVKAGAALTDPEASAERTVASMKEAFRQERGGARGVYAAAMELNPAYQTMKAVFETGQAWNKGEHRLGGEQGFAALSSAASTVAAGLGGVGIARAVGVPGTYQPMPLPQGVGATGTGGTAATVPPKGVVVNIGGEFEAQPGEIVINPGPTPTGLPRANVQLPTVAKATGANVVQAEAEAIPVKSGVASRVYARNLEPGSINWSQAAPEVSRILQPGGTVDLASFGPEGPTIASELQSSGISATVDPLSSNRLVTGIKPKQ